MAMGGCLVILKGPTATGAANVYYRPASPALYYGLQGTGLDSVVWWQQFQAKRRQFFVDGIPPAMTDAPSYPGFPESITNWFVYWDDGTQQYMQSNFLFEEVPTAATEYGANGLQIQAKVNDIENILDPAQVNLPAGTFPLAGYTTLVVADIWSVDVLINRPYDPSIGGWGPAPLDDLGYFGYVCFFYVDIFGEPYFDTRQPIYFAQQRFFPTHR